MTPEIVLQMFGDAFYLSLLMIVVIVAPSLAVGLIVSTFQAATQINEQTLSFLPRLIITILTIMYAGSWLLGQMTDLFNRLIYNIPNVIG